MAAVVLIFGVLFYLVMPVCMETGTTPRYNVANLCETATTTRKTNSFHVSSAALLMTTKPAVQQQEQQQQQQQPQQQQQQQQQMDFLSGNCSIVMHAVLHGRDDSNNKLRVQLLDLQLPCRSGYVQLFNGEEGSGFPLSGRLCGDLHSLQTSYLSFTRNVMHVRINSFNTSGPPISFTLLVTATSLFGEAGDFDCDNYWKVNGCLQCDGYNNCGDWSDEDSFLCGYVSSRLIGLIVGACLFTALVTGVIAFVCCRRRRHSKRKNNQVSASKVHYDHVHHDSALHSYGSIQSGRNSAVPPTAPTPTSPPVAPKTSP